MEINWFAIIFGQVIKYQVDLCSTWVEPDEVKKHLKWISILFKLLDKALWILNSLTLLESIC